MNVYAGALSHILREGHDQHIKADAVYALISHVVQCTTLTEAYSCNIQVTETLDMQKDPKAMFLEDWIVAKSQDPVKREIRYFISKNKLKGHRMYLQDPQIMKEYLRWHSHSVLCKGVLYRWVTPSKEDRNALQLLISPRLQKESFTRMSWWYWVYGARVNFGWYRINFIGPEWPRMQNFT